MRAEDALRFVVELEREVRFRRSDVVASLLLGSLGRYANSMLSYFGPTSDVEVFFLLSGHGKGFVEMVERGGLEFDLFFESLDVFSAGEIGVGVDEVKGLNWVIGKYRGVAVDYRETDFDWGVLAFINSHPLFDPYSFINLLKACFSKFPTKISEVRLRDYPTILRRYLERVEKLLLKRELEVASYIAMNCFDLLIDLIFALNETYNPHHYKYEEVKDLRFLPEKFLELYSIINELGEGREEEVCEHLSKIQQALTIKKKLLHMKALDLLAIGKKRLSFMLARNDLERIVNIFLKKIGVEGLDYNLHKPERCSSLEERFKELEKHIKEKGLKDELHQVLGLDKIDVEKAEEIVKLLNKSLKAILKQNP